MDSDLSLIPPGRLGALLSSKRQEAGLDLATIARASNGSLDLRDLEAIEKGWNRVNENQIETLAEIYNLESNTIVPSRSKLIVDLDGQTLSVGEKQTTFGSDNYDQILEQYLSLLYLLRDIKPGTELTLRNPDLFALEEALQKSVSDIEKQLFGLMSQPQIVKRTKWLSQKKIIPAAGLLVGLTSFGSLVILNGNSDDGKVLSTPNGISQTVESPQAKPLKIISNSATPSTVLDSVEAPSTTTPESVLESTTTSPELIPGPTITNPKVLTNNQIGKQAEALISYDFRSKLPGWKIEYKSDRQGYRGMTYVTEKRIEIYIDKGEKPGTVAEVLAHELGHAIDVTYITTAQRTQWLTVRDMPATWWPGNGLSDFHVGAGDFAEAVAKVLTNSPSDSHHGEFTPEQLKLVKQFLP